MEWWPLSPLAHPRGRGGCPSADPLPQSEIKKKERGHDLSKILSKDGRKTIGLVTAILILLFLKKKIL
jgi:hypothetical protein